jgi:hypothetical protein
MSLYYGMAVLAMPSYGGVHCHPLSTGVLASTAGTSHGSLLDRIKHTAAAISASESLGGSATGWQCMSVAVRGMFPTPVALGNALKNIR